MPSPTIQEPFVPSEEALRILREIAELCDRACREADALPPGDRPMRNLELAFDADDLLDEAISMLPGGVYASDGSVESVGADPIALLRRAERLTAALPIEHFPRGMSHFIVHLIDTIRDRA